MRIVVAAALALTMGCASASAADKKGTRFWNLASVTISKLVMAPAGTEAYGKNQCENDKDGNVSPDERLKITDIKTGSYDVKLTDQTGRVCTVRNVKVELDKVFSLEDGDLKDCAK